MSAGKREPSEPTAAAMRLEEVRKAAGFADNMRGFYREVASAVESDKLPGYDSARTYHSGREASPVYLAGIQKRFGYNMLWLATGEGEPKSPPPGVQQHLDAGFDERITAGFPEFAAFPAAARVQVYDLIIRYFEGFDARAAFLERDKPAEFTPDYIPTGPLTPQEVDMYASLRAYFMSPIETWSTGAVADPEKMELLRGRLCAWGSDYLSAMCHAISLAMSLASPFDKTVLLGMSREFAWPRGGAESDDDKAAVSATE